MAKSETNDKNRLVRLRELVSYHGKRYHHDDNPEISDQAYDALVRELAELENKIDRKTVEINISDLVKVSEIVGAEASVAFTKVKHQVRQWSFDNVFDLVELTAWETRLKKLVAGESSTANLSYMAEHKIDGLKMVLEYKAGELVRAATRGDGVVGEDVTHTARTIKTLPQTLKARVDLTCIGEVWLSKKDFAKLNGERAKAEEALFANPRNAAAGSLRQLDPEVARSRRLSFFAYDIDGFGSLDSKFKAPVTQQEELVLLKNLGLPVNPHSKLCRNTNEVEEYYQNWKIEHLNLDYDVDGIVIKVNQVSLQKTAGYTAKSPRYGIAYKFPAIETTTVVEGIELQVGRTGTITPVAHLKSVLVDGSTVARATLHNEDQIKRLDVRVGDTVILRKAGDVIPEVVSVLLELRPAVSKPYRFPKKVAACGGDGSIERIPGMAAYRCVSLDSDYLNRQALYYFVSKTALNIDGVGPKIIDALLDQQLISDAADLFKLTAKDFLKLPGFKERSAENAVAAITAAKEVSFYRLLVGLSIEQVGEETARLLARHFPTPEKLKQATFVELEEINGIGPVVAEAITLWQKDKVEQTLFNKLLEHLTLKVEELDSTGGHLVGKTFIFTGTLEGLGRTEAEAMVRQAGGSIVGSVSKKTSYVVAGDTPGSKAKDAIRLGVTILNKGEFIELVHDKK